MLTMSADIRPCQSSLILSCELTMIQRTAFIRLFGVRLGGDGYLHMSGVALTFEKLCI